ncbi:uncharacterized protein LTR77_003087 [Saxophila tyrrhenica]|uniref:F-box domain-containing protein n=1 Tax=Saxophila tyrrhenica TaxID=1690608 RepID=A0AAV9PKZ3_9PEZI|nr:hypothetical protein LTR77_003087 [Saxophila tyrrhenica]
MDSASAPSMAFAGPSSEASTPAAYDEDSARHFAVTASQVPKPTGSMAPPPPMSLPCPSLDSTSKDGKSLGMRFHEDCHETDLPSPRLRSSRLFKGKGKEAVSVEKEQKRPLQLLDLPVDILKDIVKEVTHTNDLTSLALCHSALHRLTIPHIYSRFDIVWPDTNTHAEPRSGVDALTYGLATLVMAEEVFGEAPNQRQNAGNRYAPNGQGRASETAVRRRRGNHYAQFTRKFSLGNGPADWVQEYLITKEGGKMLGTLVALAVARMRTLETFIWDMPTGILRDVWLALSSLGDRDDGQPCRLEKVWVRWHDNSSSESTNLIPPTPPPMNLSILPSAHPSSTNPPTSAIPPQIHPAALDRVEHPSFSALPPLKSLSVLDVDELAYLDEMAVLIGRSLDKLRELRVGIARHAISREWVTVWEGSSLQQVDPDYPAFGSMTIGEKRQGGVLGTLTGFVCDMRKPKMALPDRLKRRAPMNTGSPSKSPPRPPQIVPPALQVDSEPLIEQSSALSGITSLRDVLPDVPTNDPSSGGPLLSPLQTTFSSDSAYENDPLIAQSSHASSPMRSPNTETHEHSIFGSAMQPDLVPPIPETSTDAPEPDPEIEYLDHTLHLESLELERVPLSVPVLQRALDWTRLTSLTLLHCQNHEQLWKTLRRTFAPRPKSPTYPHPRRTPNSTPRKSGKLSIGGSDIEMEYTLNLKKIHTNTVSPALISFLKETLAPNSLQVLFLQEARMYNSSVSVDQIFKGPLRRHRSSLRKLLIDSSEKGADGVPTNSSRWRRWMLTREILGFVCSGKMPSLRELGMAIDYRDWHFFLQHLPSIPHLRSLSIPFLADHVHGPTVDPRELALQIVDIVALRPEVEVCYMGIAGKCFEILDQRRPYSGSWDGVGRPESHLGQHAVDAGDADEDAAAGSEGEEEGEEEAGDDDAEDEAAQAEADAEAETESESDDADDDADSESEGEDGGGGSRGVRLRLREILFYDDKVAVFKARHGRL